MTQTPTVQEFADEVDRRIRLLVNWVNEHLTGEQVIEVTLLFSDGTEINKDFPTHETVYGNLKPH